MWRETARRNDGRQRILFQSTPSVWRETAAADLWRRSATDFNPLPPCGGRRKRAARAAYIADFNPLPPCGGRPNVIVSDLLDAVFQSTPSVWRETCVGRFVYLHKIFQSTPSVWRETEALINAGAVHFRFQSTPTVWRETEDTGTESYTEKI